MARWYYTYSGLQIATELELPELATFQQDQAFSEPQVFIKLQSAADVQAKEAQDSQHYRFAIHETAHYEVREGREIRITPMEGAGQPEIRLFLLGSAWASLCYQRELLPLHAGVVRTGDSCVAFCGHSGAGKSTAAAWLTKHGFPLLSDDLCLCEPTGEGWHQVWPSVMRMKLWRASLNALGWSDEELQRDHFRLEKFHRPWTGEYVRQPAPLKSIYLLGWGDLGITRITGMVALRRLIESATYHPELLEPLNSTVSQWKHLADLTRETRVYEFTRPRDLTLLDNSMSSLVEHFSQ